MEKADVKLVREMLFKNGNKGVLDSKTEKILLLRDVLFLDKTIEIVTLCGSSKFKEQFDQANEMLTLQGKIVIPMGVYGHLMSNKEKDEKFTGEVKEKLDQLHYRKIDLSNSIYVINVNGYIGSSTRKEIEYAKKTGKRVEYLELPVDFSGDIPF